MNVLLEKDDTGIFVKPEVVVLRKGACFGVSDQLTVMWRDSLYACSKQDFNVISDCFEVHFDDHTTLINMCM